MALLQTILATLVTLGILVTIHEWGHFWVARRCGVKVLRFSVGFGKALWSRTGKDGTVYAVAAIPLGGYVKMLDEREGDVPASLHEQAFNNKPVLQRMAIVAAGPAVNLIFAVFAYWLMFIVGTSTVVPIVGSVSQGSPAALAGLTSGEEIVSIDGRTVRSWEEANLALASRVGETGVVELTAKRSSASTPERFQLPLEQWKVELESESPLSAIGITPYRPEIAPVIGQVVDGQAAKAGGLKEGDEVVAVNGQAISAWPALVSIIQASANQPLSLTVLRDGKEVSLSVTPRERLQPTGELQGYIGAGATAPEWPEAMQRSISYGPLEAVPVAITKTWNMIALTLDSIWKMIEGIISVKNLSGPITIAKVAGASAASGFEPFISFLAYLSISLGVLNLLPIPVLDGGHLLYYTIELIRGKPVSERIQDAGLKMGMAVLLSLMTVAIVNDFLRL
ncbi:sigma E protease regulator RseP [Neptunomonas phycophila]|jgi:regulator of sigma E protease|uniref:sigma E protease regulator RseP n=1 Tax=Neptunomonas phycophila TaxID=1572645 RepID=UPI000948D1AC|nr:sigma E protease regulator RseP [Neptunomonas phycophila]MBT3144452.1 sigma E protease regulator RseP [Neptunomonas phycophila]MDO6784199.1 sigma E protease regulator RseP [Neptunomonas phycophila]